MMPLFTAPHRFVCLAIVFGLGGLVSCQPPASTNEAPRVSSTERVGLGSHSAHGAVRDLGRDEAAGGHNLRKHVGQTDDELRDRLRRESRITGASTYTDRAIAERSVGEAIAQSQDRIERWLTRTGGHPNLVLDYDSPVPIGRTINRGESESHTCAHAIVVLKYSGINDYYVLTSYPECRA